MNHLDLFSGIGGFSLAAQWVWGEDHNIIAFCEIDKFCQKVLKKHWPNVPIFPDIKKLKGDEFVEAVDLITAGFPCQPASAAGKRRGTKDNRWLWPETFKTIQLFSPEWIILENVYGLITLNKGMVFEQVCADLESEGYEVQPFVIPACAVNAPHRRDRVWIIAHANLRRCKKQWEQIEVESNIFEFEREIWRSVKPTVCRINHGIPNRVDRLRSLGNAIVPQVAAIIMQSIREVGCA